MMTMNSEDEFMCGGKLERELELRRKQYGYYRDMLLAFPEQKGV